MAFFLDVIQNWQFLVFLTCTALITCAGLLACYRVRRLSECLSGKLEELAETQAKLHTAVEEVANLEETSYESEAIINQLRQENIEYRVRGEERASQLLQVKQEAEASRQELNELTAHHSKLQTELAEVKTAAEKDRIFQTEKQEMFEQSRSQLKQELQNLANNILENNTSKLAASNEHQLKQVLSPVREQLQSFQKKVEDVYEKESRQRFSLVGEINKLQNLNERISGDAIALTNALKGENKVAGNWGEVILERLLEASGLANGREFEVQSSRMGPEGQRLQPDVIISLPQGKSIIIDSKVSLVGYEKFFNADCDEQKALATREHLGSIRQHIKGLSKKKYDQIKGLRTLDFVLLFIPVEGAFMAAVQQDNTLLTESYQQNIILVSPSTLLSTLRVIHNLWQQDSQNKNAQEIARQAGNLYDKFASFAHDLLAIGQRLEQSQTAYQHAVERLSSGRGNLLARVENLKKLGARASKQLPSEFVVVNDQKPAISQTSADKAD